MPFFLLLFSVTDPDLPLLRPLIDHYFLSFTFPLGSRSYSLTPLSGLFLTHVRPTAITHTFFVRGRLILRCPLTASPRDELSSTFIILR